MGAADYPLIDDETLPGIIESEVARSIGHWDGELSAARTKEFDYYYGKPFGNEADGESQVVSTDVADTVEGILPIILNIFTASDDVVRFDPNGPEDEEQAKQQTEVANYVFYRQNNGFLVLYEWFKDALIQKNGIVKYWWEEKQEKTKETYHGLTEGEYRTLMQDDSYVEIEELEHSEYPDGVAEQQKAALIEKISAQPIPEQQKAMMLAQIEAQPMPMLHDVTVRIVKDASKLCIVAVPPEEFGISPDHNCVSIQDTPFCYHRTRKSISSLRAEGCPEEILAELVEANNPDFTPEAIARDKFTDMTVRFASGGPENVQKYVWVTECYFRVDYDGDGVAELRHIIMPGRKIWINEECAHINFAAITPIIMPHRWVGRSVAELVMDIQYTKSVIWRQMLNNLYLTNNPRKVVLSSAGGVVQANLDDLLTSRVGGLVREYMPNAVRNEETPFVAGASFPMLEYMDGIKENRTGVTRYNQGTDADSLNKTARGIQMIQAAGQLRPNLIARIFAETGVKDLMRGIVYMLSKYSARAMTLKLRNQWVDIDPREWKTQYNMTVNVGLGTGNRDVQIAQMNALHAQQLELMQTGRGYMVSDENIYNLYRKMSEAMGFKHPELFVTDPKGIPPEAKKPPTPPEIIKAQAEDQQEKAKLQFNQWKEQFSARAEAEIAKIAAQSQVAIAQMDNATKKEIEQMKIAAQAQLAVFEQNADQKNGAAQAGEKLQAEAAKLAQKSAELEVQALEVAHAEEILKLKERIDKMAEQHRADLTKEHEFKVESRENEVIGTVGTALQMVAAELAKAGAILDAGLKTSTASLQLHGEMLDALKKPRTSTIENLMMGEDGKVKGATVKSTIQ